MSVKYLGSTENGERYTWITDAEYDALLEKLRPRLSDKFLATLKDAADLTLCDSMEVDAFVAEVLHWAGRADDRLK